MLVIPPRDRLIVALDLPDVAEARAMVDVLGETVRFYKVGLELIYAGGLAFARELAASGRKVFVDAKLLDIDNTVAGAVISLLETGATFVTVHAYPKAMRAAVAARGSAPLGLLGVTVLTSMDEGDIRAAGYAGGLSELVAHRAEDARKAGMNGVVVSPAEAAAVRRIVGPDFPIVTPGIRPAGADRGDQRRTATPTEAIRAGADYLVVGRPITGERDPMVAAEAIVGEIAAAAAAEQRERA